MLMIKTCIQERERPGVFELYEIAGESTPGDLFTTFPLSQERITFLVQLLRCEFRDGRVGSASNSRLAGRVTIF